MAARFLQLGFFAVLASPQRFYWLGSRIHIDIAFRA
jgi:hypothetical protein